MTETTFEQAKRCPKCEQPGQIVAERRQRDGSVLNTVMCKNTRCRWLNTTYIVQVNADGTIPITIDRPKSFTKLPDRTEEVQAQMENLYNQTLSGGELRN